MTADALEHNTERLASPGLLRKIDQLRELNIGQHVSLPQLVVVGDQSSGKSSLLQSLTNIPFPRNLELCTRYATQITSRRDSKSRVEVTIIPGPHSSDAHKKHLAGFNPGVFSTEELHDQFPGILEQANRHMGVRTDNQSRHGTVFSEDILKIEMYGPNEDYLTVIDVPGIFRNPTEGITTRDDVGLVQTMVKQYIKDSRTIILAILPSNVDIATQEVLTFAEEFDKAGERTLGVLTKPDLVTEQSAKAVICNLVMGKRRPLALGYYVVRSRGADSGDDFSYKEAEKIFREAPWNGLPADRVGVHALKARLSELLNQITRKEFPQLRKEITKQLSDCRVTLKECGPARQTEHEQRVFLSNMARKFQRLVDAALNAHYASNSVFEEREELRLITHVVNLTESFSQDFETKAHLRPFSEVSRTTLQDGVELIVSRVASETSVECDDGDDHSVETTSQVSNSDIIDMSFLEGVITTDEDVEDPHGDIMEWTEDLYRRSRSVELGTFGGSILSSAFKEQSEKWKHMTHAYVSHVIVAIHKFMTAALRTICTNSTISEEIWSSVCDKVVEGYKAAVDHAMFLVSIERDKRPYTLNHYFNDNLQITRNNRIVEILSRKARKETKRDNQGYTVSSDNLIVDLDAVQNATDNRSNLEQVKEDIHDILCSYYKVARKRFVDNVYHQAVDHFLLTGPTSPLFVFSQDWVLELDPERLDFMVGESAPTRGRREMTIRKIQDLDMALKILGH